jgi:hypothetical protein
MTWKRNITIEQGTSFEMIVEVTDDDDNPIDYTGYEPVGNIRKNNESANSIVFDISIDINNLTVSLDASATVNAYPGKYIYDILVRDPSNHNSVEKIIEGVCLINPTASQWLT